jgi:signal peptidase II
MDISGSEVVANQSSQSRSPFRRNAIVFWTIALAGAGFDLATKYVVFSTIGPQGGRPVSIISPVLEFQTSHNPGALWGLGGGFASSSLFFAVLSLAAGAFIIYWLFFAGHITDLKQTAALGLIMAGALGNCYDRLRFGYVRDFVYFHVDSIDFHFPIFNFADNMLVIGATMLLLLQLRASPTAAQPPKAAAPPQMS